MTLEVAAAVCSLVAARLDMMFPSLKADNPYTPKIDVSLLRKHIFCQGIDDLRGRERSQRSEPGFPGSLCTSRREGDRDARPRRALGRRQQNGVDHVDHAVRLIDVGDGDRGGVAFGV